jgi:hypothetical protein
MQVTTTRTQIAKALTVLCVALVFAMGTVHAVHSHPANSQTSRHSCSICSAPTLGPTIAALDMLSMSKPVAMVHVAGETFVVFRTTSTNPIRPPPAV